MNNTLTIDVVVTRRELQGTAVAVLDLADPTGRPLPPFTAGAHVDVHLADGLIRQYSLCGDPGRHAVYRLGVLRDPNSRGGSAAVHRDLIEGAGLRIGAPRNHFPLAATAPNHVLIGGGIGVTPMLSMAWALHATGRPFELHYCVSSRAAAAFLQELEAAPWARRVRVYFADTTPETAGGFRPAEALTAAPHGSHAYVCGPQGFMSWVMTEAGQAGLAPQQVHREYFAAPESTTTRRPDRPFEAVAARSGLSTWVEPGQSLLDALRGLGLKVPVSCEEGVCGSCACTVLEGQPDHRDAYLTEDERAANDQILVCCSRAAGDRLVLDL